MSVPKLLVVGGNGYLGSAICKAAVTKGWEVSSMSSSGKPYTTPASHTPSWVPSVKWHKASAFEPATYRSLVGESTAVVHTLGILLESQNYKKAIQQGDVLGLARAFLGGDSGNPLKSEADRRRGYEGMNKDSALQVLDTMLETGSEDVRTGMRRPFVYISAADAFRPFVPGGYIETKRQAELEIQRRCDAGGDGSDIRPVYVRPGKIASPLFWVASC
ncbi:hypothetical protein P7C73_g6389, partial [Tremellales sp. Uapishka_1]